MTETRNTLIGLIRAAKVAWFNEKHVQAELESILYSGN
jgi:hypothetical protein